MRYIHVYRSIYLSPDEQYLVICIALFMYSIKRERYIERKGMIYRGK